MTADVKLIRYNWQASAALVSSLRMGWYDNMDLMLSMSAAKAWTIGLACRQRASRAVATATASGTWKSGAGYYDGRGGWQVRQVRAADDV